MARDGTKRTAKRTTRDGGSWRFDPSDDGSISDPGGNGPGKFEETVSGIAFSEQMITANPDHFGEIRRFFAQGLQAIEPVSASQSRGPCEALGSASVSDAWSAEDL